MLQGESMTSNKYHLQEQEIPDGYEIFEERLEVSGIQYRKNDALAFATKTDGIWLEFEREENNKYDRNAIKIIGCSKELFVAKKSFVGYVPKEIAKLIIEGGFWEQVKPRLLKIYVGKQDFVEILFQLLGPKGKKYDFKQTKDVKGGHYTDYVDRVKQLIREKQHNEAIELLLRLIDEVEEEAKREGHGVAPWYYDQLANIYKKEKRTADEIKILERFEKQPKAPGSSTKWLEKRLEQMRQSNK